MLASGIYGAFDPVANLDKYGIKAEEKGKAMCADVLVADSLGGRAEPRP